MWISKVLLAECLVHEIKILYHSKPQGYSVVRSSVEMKLLRGNHKFLDPCLLKCGGCSVHLLMLHIPEQLSFRAEQSGLVLVYPVLLSPGACRRRLCIPGSVETPPCIGRLWYCGFIVLIQTILPSSVFIFLLVHAVHVFNAGCL